MADVSDPLELGKLQASEEFEDFKEASIQDFRETVGQYAEVRDLVQHPGWPTLIKALEKRSEFWKSRAMELLTSILLRNDKANDSAFSDARIHHLASEEAINILLVMRVDARDAQEKLDKLSAEMRDSNQNG